MNDENFLHIQDQEGMQTLRLVGGGYHVQDGRITISIETENVDSEGWPPCAMLCIYKCPIEDALTSGNTFEAARDANEDEESGLARAYFSFHAETVYVKWTVLEIRDDAVLFRLEAAHDDPRYYDHRTKECPTSGVFALQIRPLNELWAAV